MSKLIISPTSLETHVKFAVKRFFNSHTKIQLELYFQRSTLKTSRIITKRIMTHVLYIPSDLYTDKTMFAKDFKTIQNKVIEEIKRFKMEFLLKSK